MIERYRLLLEAKDVQQMRYMAQQWLQVENALMGRIETLSSYVVYMREQGQRVSMTSVMRLQQYKDLLAQARIEVERYNRYTEEQIRRSQVDLVQHGVNAAVEQINAAYMDAGRSSEFITRLPVRAVEYMIGYASNGAPLNKLLMRDYSKNIASLTQTLIDSTAQGINPRVTARKMADNMAGNLQRALTIARTEQNRTFRTANTMAARESGLVRKWIWRSALQERTCIACLAQDGTEYPLEEELNDHPNGRCFKQWVIRGLQPVGAQSGQEWFQALGEDKQKELLGPKRYEAWQNGANFRDFAAIAHNSVWGNTLQIAPLSSI